MVGLIVILLIAASPVILILVFSEVMAAKEGSETNDYLRKFAKILAWVLFGLFSTALLYSVLTDYSSSHNFRDVIKVINFFLKLI